MPHISLKMLKGRTEEQKKAAADKLAAALCEAIDCGDGHVTVSIEDYTPEEWQTVFAEDIEGKSGTLYRKPNYDPKSLL